MPMKSQPDPAHVPTSTRAVRVCLRCNSSFESASAGNRICNHCKHKLKAMTLPDDAKHSYQRRRQSGIPYFVAN